VVEGKWAPRVNYDEIAHGYDGQPYREKDVDAHLQTFLTAYASPMASLSILDMGCGTGSQLLANQIWYPNLRMFGLDLFAGMLRQAQPKSSEIDWIQGDNAAPPFAGNSFDYITNQYSFHHVRDKMDMIHAVFRILRPAGRFVMTNICPREMPQWLYYHYFPEAYKIDLQDFLPWQRLAELLRRTGFINVHVDLNQMTWLQELLIFDQLVRQRTHCSQLIRIPDDAYQAGLLRLEADLQRSGPEANQVRQYFCVLTLTADKA
jgi:ubiquinone/menaquinone biosynthesis C-methylase UbiE